MATYLYFIGAMNVLGVFVLLGALSDDFSDGLLRRWTQIVPKDRPFAHSADSRIWLWWAIIGTGFFGPINLVAAGWPEAYARFVVYGDVYAYGAFELLAIAASISRRYGPGIPICHVLWLVQGGWGAYVAFA